MRVWNSGFAENMHECGVGASWGLDGVMMRGNYIENVGIREWFWTVTSITVSVERSSRNGRSFCLHVDTNIAVLMVWALICLTAAAMTATGHLILTVTRSPGQVLCSASLHMHIVVANIAAL